MWQRFELRELPSYHDGCGRRSGEFVLGCLGRIRRRIIDLVCLQQHRFVCSPMLYGLVGRDIKEKSSCTVSVLQKRCCCGRHHHAVLTNHGHSHAWSRKQLMIWELFRSAAPARLPSIAASRSRDLQNLAKVGFPFSQAPARLPVPAPSSRWTRPNITRIDPYLQSLASHKVIMQGLVQMMSLTFAQ